MCSSQLFIISRHYFHLVRIEKILTQITKGRKKKGSKVKKTETKTKEETNIRVVREALEALNSGDLSRVHELSPQYFNHESQVDPVRGQLRGPEEFINTQSYS